MSINDPKEWLETLKNAIDEVKTRINDTSASFKEATGILQQLIKRAIIDNHSVFWVGNGGSAAICSHLSQDMINKLGIKSYCFNDSSLVTCMTNDYGYENVYSRPLSLYASKNDILIAISSSGNSRNILNCVETARNKNMKIITLSGFTEDNKLWARKSNVSFFVSSDLYGIVELTHEAILHGVIETIWIGRDKSNTLSEGKIK